CVNTLTMFAMVLAIGLLVDDAIVVVENVERVMAEEGLSPLEATRKSMGQIQGALVAIGLVLSAIFLPMAFFGGSTGVIYRQFSITIVSAMALSVLVALILSPALTSTLLKPRAHGAEGDGAHRFPRLHDAFERAKAGFNTRFDRASTGYAGSVAKVVDRKWLFLAIYALAIALLVLLFYRLPSGFLPNEDQGRVSIQFRLPAGATLERT